MRHSITRLDGPSILLAIIICATGCLFPENAPRAIRQYPEVQEPPHERLDEEQQLATVAKTVGEDFRARNPGAPKLVVAVIPFSFSSGSRTDFSARTTDAVSRHLGRDDAFVLVNRSRVDILMEEHSFVRTSGLISPQLAAEMGRGLGAHAVLTGKIYEFENRYKLELQLISVEKTVELANGVAQLSRPQTAAPNLHSDALETTAFLFVPEASRSRSGALVRILVTNRSPIARYIRFPVDERRTYLTDGSGRQYFPDWIQFGGVRHRRGDLLGAQPEQELLPTRGARAEISFSNVPQSEDMELTLHYRFNQNDKFLTFTSILR
jgi:hypothetical protein